MSYAQRYLTIMIFNITLEGLDNDGNRQQSQPQQQPQRQKTQISDSRFAEVVAKIKTGEVNIARLVNNHELTAPQKKIFQSEFPQVQL